MADTAFIEQLRQELPRLLREHPEVRHELWGLMLEAFPSRQEFMDLLEEVRAAREEDTRRFEALRQDMNSRFEAVDQRFEALRQDMNRRFEAVDRRFEEMRQDMNSRFEAVDRRFEAVDRRFEAVDRRFEEVIAELRRHSERFDRLERQMRELNLHMSALGGRVGFGLEHIVREIVEEFAGESFPSAQRLVLRDETGEVYGVAGAEVEFDLYAHNGTAYLVEVKSHLKSNDVLMFHRKVRFAEARLNRQVIPMVIALSMESRAAQQMQTLGIKYRVRAVLDRNS